MKRPAIFTRPAKPLSVPVPKRDWLARTVSDAIAAPVAVHASTECHVTPVDVAARMAGYADISAGLSVLEPSAGTGSLLRAIVHAGADTSRVTFVELDSELFAGLSATWIGIHDDFLDAARDWSGRCKFDRIVMNPPFRKVRAHVVAAESLLAPNGILVALVPVTFEHDRAEELETLPANTFALAKVYTKIIRVHA